MSESAIIWVIIGVFLTLSNHSWGLSNRTTRSTNLKKTKESEVDANNSDSTNKVKDDTLFSSFPISEVKLWL